MYIYVKSVINRFVLNHRYYIHLQLTANPLSVSFSCREGEGEVVLGFGFGVYSSFWGGGSFFVIFFGVVGLFVCLFLVNFLLRFLVFFSLASISSSDAVVSALVTLSRLHAASLALPEDDIDDAAGEGQGEGQPCQDVGKAIGGVFRGLVPVRVPHCEDGGATHHAESCRGKHRWGKG